MTKPPRRLMSAPVQRIQNARGIPRSMAAEDNAAQVAGARANG